MDVSLLGMVKIITAGVSRIYRSLALSSSSLAESYANALEYNGLAIRRNVRFGSKADIAAHSSDVRFTPKKLTLPDGYAVILKRFCITLCQTVR